MARNRVFLLLVLFFSALSPALIVKGQADADCGVVDAIDYPIDGVSIEHDDFGLFRASFKGHHTGIDMGFDRYGAPVRAAARGRVTFSDPEGWDTEKGVVIIEHIFPGRRSVFSLYGHMEELNGVRFPRVGQCVQRGEIIGSVGRPNLSASHLHYEIRRMRASTGGPGYWSTDPLDGGWYHPIEFTEQWRLRFNPAFRSIVTASSPPAEPPILMQDGSAIFAATRGLEQRRDNDTLWQLSVRGLLGVVSLPDGRLLGRTIQNRVYLFNGAGFDSAWTPDRALRTPPMRLDDAVVFLDDLNRAVAYRTDGSLLWQSDPLGEYVEQYAHTGRLLAAAVEREGSYRFVVVNSAGEIIFQASAPAPVVPIASGDGFILLVASQVSRFSPDLTLTPLIDAGQLLRRGSQAAIDPQGNVYLYPGAGQEIYAYTPDGALRWRTRLPAPPMQPPLLAVGSGCLVYALTFDGALLAYRPADGGLRGLVALYAGGEKNNPAARSLAVLPGEQVQFSAGYLSTATLDGPTLGGVSGCVK